jgi:benzoylformate decarboxylase
MAAPVTKWSVQAERADEIAPILRRAFKVATDAPKGPVFVSLPIDVMEQETSVEPVGPDKLWRSTHPDPRGIEKVACLLLKSARPAIVAGDDVARSGTNEALVALAEAIGASVWCEGLRAHAPFPTSHPNYRQSLPSDAAPGSQGISGCRSHCSAGGAGEDIWYAAGSHFPEGAVVIQIEESPERLAFNHHLDAGIVGDIATSIASLVDTVRSRQTPDLKVAAQRRNQALADLIAREKEAHRARLEKGWNREPSSMAR